MTIESNKATARSIYEELFNRRNPNYLDQITTANYTVHAPGMPGGAGLEVAKGGTLMFLTALPDLVHTLDDLVAEGDRVISRWHAHGTHKGTLMDIPPTARPVTLSCITILRFENGKLAEEWAQMDMMGLMQQLGVMPAPTAT